MNVATRLTMTISFFFLLNSAARFALCQFYWTHTISTATVGWAKAGPQFPSLSLFSKPTRPTVSAYEWTSAGRDGGNKEHCHYHASRTTKIMTSPVIAFELN
jgi:hypothetical protein